MFIAVDDTDSRTGNCTTFVATEIIRELDDMDLIGNPRLVRLNPAVPWKTRGNASIVLQVGRGAGGSKKVGEISGREIFSFQSLKEEPDAEDLLPRVVRAVMSNRSEGAESGIVVSETRPDPSLYWSGVRTILTKDAVDRELRRISARTYTADSGLGLIGAVCGMAWIPGDSTYELIAYRDRKRWGTERTVAPCSIREMDMKFQTTFNSWEERTEKVTMVPSTPCPVLYGLRGDVEEDLPAASRSIVSEYAERWIVFLTNQGTDDHIISGPTELIACRSYRLAGTVSGRARRMKGGHVFIDVDTEFGKITCGAYEPSKEFRMLFDRLIPGDRIEVLGELRSDPRTLNVEKVCVTGLAPDEARSNPPCPKCGKNMKSAGTGQGYRCRECRTRAKHQDIREEGRSLVPGWYEPPAAARRHLSKPLKRMGAEQPIEFVRYSTEEGHP